MRKITKNIDSMVDVESEPGDATRYEYTIVYSAKHRRFHIVSSNVKNARVIEEYQVVALWKKIKDRPVRVAAGLVLEEAEYFDCNPYTLVEIVTGIQEWRNSYIHRG
jgi:hypothetical protein